MAKRGRQSAAELSIVSIGSGHQRLVPPLDLNARRSETIPRASRILRPRSFRAFRHAAAGELRPGNPSIEGRRDGSRERRRHDRHLGEGNANAGDTGDETEACAAGENRSENLARRSGNHHPSAYELMERPWR